MTRDEAKMILLLYRPGTADIADPQIAAALAQTKDDPELARWFEDHCARQNVLRKKFREIAAPAGLREQIISEQAARKIIFLRRHFDLAAAAIVIGLLALAFFALSKHGKKENAFAIYENQMAGIALRSYAMDLTSDDPKKIRAYFAQNRAPSDFVLPAGLQKADLIGCAVENWRGAKISMICFRAGKSLPPGQQSDLWLFVVDRAAVKNVAAMSSPQIAKVNRLITASWTQGDKLYLLGAEGDEQTIRKFL